MLLQRAGTGTIAPTGFIPPQWGILAELWDSAPKPASTTVTLGPATISIGHDDNEADDGKPYVAGHEFGWDNEHPKREVNVAEFRIEWRPITNGEFYDFYKGQGNKLVGFPASWVQDGDDGQVGCCNSIYRLCVFRSDQVRPLYGPVPMQIAQHWPLITSYDNLSTYASVKGGRIPTEPELRLFFDKFECGFEGGGNVGFRNWHPVP